MHRWIVTKRDHGDLEMLRVNTNNGEFMSVVATQNNSTSLISTQLRLQMVRWRFNITDRVGHQTLDSHKRRVGDRTVREQISE